VLIFCADDVHVTRTNRSFPSCARSKEPIRLLAMIIFTSAQRLLVTGCLLSSCLGFAPVSLPSSHDNARTSAFFGLSNVNDYFDSFPKNDNTNDESNKDPRTNEPRQGSSYVSINDYFRSFNKPNTDKSDDGKSTETWHGNDNFDINTYSGSGISKETERMPPNPPPRIQQMTFSEIVAYNNARLCPKMFLTQRAIQSFCYLLAECRDPHSGKVRAVSSGLISV